MLTVKYIDMEGNQKIYPCFSVEFRPEYSRKERNTCGPSDRLIAFTEDRFVVGEFETGTAYVMNSEGKTISRYDLCTPPKPE